MPGRLARSIKDLFEHGGRVSRATHQERAWVRRGARVGCGLWGTLAPVSDRQILEEFRRRLTEAVRSAPAQDLEKNLHALLGAFFERFDLASREELEVQKTLIERAQAKLAALEARVAEIESRKR